MCSFLLTTLRLLNLTHANFYLKQRGPDHTSHVSSGGFHFVHNLLSQTGNLSAQPLVTADGNVLVLFNGEVYNYRELGNTQPSFVPGVLLGGLTHRVEFAPHRLQLLDRRRYEPRVVVRGGAPGMQNTTR